MSGWCIEWLVRGHRRWRGVPGHWMGRHVLQTAASPQCLEGKLPSVSTVESRVAPTPILSTPSPSARPDVPLPILPQVPSPYPPSLEPLTPHPAQVCTKMRSLTPGVPPPIIMISGRASTNDVVKGLQAGSQDYICKPFQPQEVLARIETQLRLYMGEMQQLQVRLRCTACNGLGVTLYTQYI